MAEIITDFGEVRMSLKEYDNMRDEIHNLKEQNGNLTEILDHVCEENKIRVRRQIITETRMTTNPRALGTREVIEDKLINCDDLTQELDAKINTLQDEFQKKEVELQRIISKMEWKLEECKRKKSEAEQKLLQYKAHGWWNRLWNK